MSSKPMKRMYLSGAISNNPHYKEENGTRSMRAGTRIHRKDMPLEKGQSGGDE